MIAIATQCFRPDIGGIENLMTGLADQLFAAGHNVEVFADHIRSPARQQFQRSYPVGRFGGPRPLRVLMKRRAIALAARDGGVCAIFADSWKSVAAIPPGVGPIAVLAHGMELPSGALLRRARRVRAAFARADAIVANSAYTASLAAEFLGDGATRIAVVHPPIAPPPPASLEALSWIDALIAGRGPVLATLARLEPRKGVDAVLRALPALRAQYPGVIYLIGGGGEDSARLRELAASLNLGEGVVFLGRVDEAQKAALLTRADIFAMPVRREGGSVEGYGIAFVEAAWHGAPALAGREGGAVDAVIDGETGLICEGADQRDVTRALERLIGDADLRQRLGANAAARARGRTWEAMLPKYLAAVGL